MGSERMMPITRLSLCVQPPARVERAEAAVASVLLAAAAVGAAAATVQPLGAHGAHPPRRSALHSHPFTGRPLAPLTRAHRPPSPMHSLLPQEELYLAENDLSGPIPDEYR